jgi:hypothetical protein
VNSSTDWYPKPGDVVTTIRQSREGAPPAGYTGCVGSTPAGYPNANSRYCWLDGGLRGWLGTACYVRDLRPPTAEELATYQLTLADL